jgi:hypothetical protein
MIAPEILADVGPLLADLEEIGYRVVASQYDRECFGNWVVDLAGPNVFRITKDRSQYLVDADKASLDRAGLCHAFDDRAEFARLLLAWAAR